MISEGWSSKYLFRLLDYEHYDIFHKGVQLGMVIINHADQSVETKLFDDVDPWVQVTLPVSYKRMRKWLRSIEEPTLS